MNSIISRFIKLGKRGTYDACFVSYFLTGMMYRRRVLLSAIKRRFSSRPSGPTATG